MSDVASARDDFENGIVEAERERLEVRDESLRVSYFDSVRSLYDELIVSLALEGDADDRSILPSAPAQER